MDNNRASGVVSGILLPIGLVCLFAFCSLALALFGGRSYRQIQQGIDDSYDSTVAANYLRTKLSQNNTQDAISLRDEAGLQVLAILSEQDGTAYETRIFATDGQLKEAFVQADSPFQKTAGTDVADVESCLFAIDGGLFTAEIVSVLGTTTRTAFSLAGGASA